MEIEKVEQIEKAMNIELARIREMAIKLNELADKRETEGAPAEEVATLRMQTASLSALHVTTALQILTSLVEDDEDDEDDYDPCAEADGDCDEEPFDCHEDCSTCAEREPCLESNGRGPQAVVEPDPESTNAEEEPAEAVESNDDDDKN